MTSQTTKDVLTQCMDALGKEMLSIGSGDGSQQAAIVKKGLRRLQVTFYDRREVVLMKYPHSKETLEYLEKNCETTPRFNVDATKIDEIYKPESFDLIFFTFPHTGVPNDTRTNISSNQTLLRGFLKAASKLLRSGGEIQVTLKNGHPYEQWKLPSLLDEKFGLTFQSTHTFEPNLFPGYKHRLTKGMNGSLKVVPNKNGAKVHVFTRPQRQSNNDTTSRTGGQLLFEGKLLTIVEPSIEGIWDDQELWAETISVLKHFKTPKNVLEIRRTFDPPPDTRQLNRVVYNMEREGIVQRHPPSSSTKSKKPRWKLCTT